MTESEGQQILRQRAAELRQHAERLEWTAKHADLIGAPKEACEAGADALRAMAATHERCATLPRLAAQRLNPGKWEQRA